MADAQHWREQAILGELEQVKTERDRLRRERDAAQQELNEARDRLVVALPGGDFGSALYSLVDFAIGHIDTLTAELAVAVEQRDFWLAKANEVNAERDRLFLLINAPRTDDFFEAVRIEAAHQVERWGVEHDAGKRAEDWTALLVRLLGKVVDAHWNGDRDKLLHHVITLAAVALNWHRNVTGVTSAMRPGIAPRTFVRSNPDPASGLPYEVCVTCGKHIRNHYGFGAKTSAEYRCDPNDTVAPGRSTAP